MSTFRLALVGLLLMAGCHSRRPPETPASVLPLRTLRLYETGVGYFERAGTVAARHQTALPVPAGHIDDALMTLVVLSKDGQARVDGLEFQSSVAKGMARALAGLPREGDEPLSYQDLLVSLKGAQVTIVTAEERVEGRLIEVRQTVVPPQAAPEDQGGTGKKPRAPRPTLTLLLLTNRGELQRFVADEVTAVRPADPAYTVRLRSALDALSTRGAQSRRLLRVMAEAQGPVTLGYIAETPLWRTTYRLVMRGQQAGVLQGWALLHNDTDEDWQRVKVELVNGRPDSFLFPLAAPRYSRRELVAPEHALPTVPQLLGTTVDTLWGDHLEGEGTIGLGSLGTIGHGGGGGGGAGYGRGVGRIGVREGSRDEPSAELKVGNLAAIAKASGVEAGALFVYTLAQPLSLRAHASALVPFIQTPIDVKAITWMSGPDTPARTAVRLRNNTGKTLPTGPLAIFADGGFAGESALDRLKPGERRFIQFGADLDLELTTKKTKTHLEPRRVTFKDDLLAEHRLRRREVTYAVENRGGQGREVHLALKVVANATVKGADALDYDEATAQPVAVFKVPAHHQTTRVLTIEEGLVQHTRLRRLTVASLSKLAAQTTLPDPTRAILKEAAARQQEVEKVEEQLQQNRRHTKEIKDDLERLRKHLNAAGGQKGGGAAKLVQRILGAEDRLGTLRRAHQTLKEQLKARRKSVGTALARLKPTRG